MPHDPEERKRFSEAQKAARERSRQGQRLELAAHFLAPAIRAMKLAGEDASALEASLHRTLDRLAVINHEGHGPILPRQRPLAQKQWATEGPRSRYHVYIDESGGSRLNLTRNEPFFAVGGLVIREDDCAAVERAWLDWKLRWVGRPAARMHSDRLTPKSIGHYAKLGPSAQALESLDEILDSVEATLIVVAIRKSEFLKLYADGQVDPFVPSHHYELCLMFLLERVLHFLLENDDAHAHIIAESRNRPDDARLQLEYQRLQVEGSLYQAPTWFRYQLGPHITFRSKSDNVTGLQIIDILLRPVIEKLREPGSQPHRWASARDKLYDGGKGRIRGWGLKLFPDDHQFVEEIVARI